MRVRWGPMVGIRCQRFLSTETNIPEFDLCSLLTEHSGNPLLFQQTTERISWIVCFRLQNLLEKSVAFCWTLKKQDAIQNKHKRLVFRRLSRNTRRHTHGEVRFRWFSELFLGLCHDSGRDWKPCNWPLCCDKAASPALSLSPLALTASTDPAKEDRRIHLRFPDSVGQKWVKGQRGGLLETNKGRSVTEFGP